MSKLPPIKRLSLEEFADQKKWISRLLDPLNTFLLAVHTALNRGLTLRENLSADILTAEVESATPALKLAWRLKSRPVAVHVGDVARVDGVTPTVSAAPGVRWSFTQDGALQVDEVFGVSPSTTARYRLTLVCFTG